MSEQNTLVIAMQDLPVVRDRLDVARGDPSDYGGGDGHGDAGGDGLNIPTS